MVLCCLRGVFACVSRTWLPLEHSLLLSEPCWGNGCLHSTWPVVCIFSGCCWCNLCVKIYIHPHPTWIYPLNSSKKVVQKRDDTNQNVDVLQSTPGIYVLNTFFFFSLSLSLSLSTYDWVTGFGRRDDHYSNLLFLGDIPFFLPKKRRHENEPQIQNHLQPVDLTLCQFFRQFGFFQPHTASTGPL